MDCFAALAMTTKRALAASQRNALESCMILPPLEGVGNAGCPLHPQRRVHFVLVEAHEQQRVHRNHPAFPHAMVLTVSFVLSPVNGLFCHRHQRINVLSKPGWADATSANLTPASGRQDHTTSPYAATSLVRSLGDRSQAFRQPALQSRRAQDAAASTAFHPAFPDDHDTPLWWGGMRQF